MIQLTKNKCNINHHNNQYNKLVSMVILLLILHKCNKLMIFNQKPNYKFQMTIKMIINKKNKKNYVIL